MPTRKLKAVGKVSMLWILRIDGLVGGFYRIALQLAQYTRGAIPVLGSWDGMSRHEVLCKALRSLEPRGSPRSSRGVLDHRPIASSRRPSPSIQSSSPSHRLLRRSSPIFPLRSARPARHKPCDDRLILQRQGPSRSSDARTAEDRHEQPFVQLFHRQRRPFTHKDVLYSLGSAPSHLCSFAAASHAHSVLHPRLTTLPLCP